MRKAIPAHKYKRINCRFLAALMILSVMFCAFPATGSLAAPEVYAATYGAAVLERGDLLTIKEGSWEHEFIVLDPQKTNTRKPGIFLLQKDYPDKIAFNYEDADLESANSWEDSLAQSWCTDYYRAMPDTVRNAVIGVKTVETESGFKWAGVNNIDGTRTGVNKDKDKVFFLSYIEYDSNKDSADIVPGEKWFLRSPYACGDLKVYVCVVTEDGSIHDFGTSSPTILGARPAFNIDPTLSDMSTKCRHGNKVTWTVGTGGVAATYDGTAYTWSSDNLRCTATAVCGNCGKKVSETAIASVSTRNATTTSEGCTTYTAAFKDPGFAVQTKDVKIPKLTAKKTLLNKKLPRPVLKKPSRVGRTITVKWKALSASGRKKINGIEIMAATDKNFKKNRIVKTVSKTKKVYKIKGLKPKKTYWIRVRTYKKTGGIKYVGRWSKAKRVRAR